MFKRAIHTTAKVCETASKSNTSKASPFGSLKDAFASANEIQTSAKTTINDRFIPNFIDKTTYDPFDFSIASQRYQNKVMKTQLSQHMKSSSFNALEINPTDFYVLPHLLSSYMNVSGQILHRSVTGLSPKKQKQMSKAIRRARSFGLMSSVAKDVSTFPKRGSSL